MFTAGYNGVVLYDGYDDLVLDEHERHPFPTWWHQQTGSLKSSASKRLSSSFEDALNSTQRIPSMKDVDKVVLELNSSGFVIPGFQHISAWGFNGKPTASTGPMQATKAMEAADCAEKASGNQLTLGQQTTSAGPKQIRKTLVATDCDEDAGEDRVALLERLLCEGKRMNLMQPSLADAASPKILEDGLTECGVLPTDGKGDPWSHQSGLLEMLLQSGTSSDAISSSEDIASDTTDTTKAIDDAEEEERQQTIHVRNAYLSVRKDHSQTAIPPTKSAMRDKHRQRQALNQKLREDRVKLAQNGEIAKDRCSQYKLDQDLKPKSLQGSQHIEEDNWPGMLQCKKKVKSVGDEGASKQTRKKYRPNKIRQ